MAEADPEHGHRLDQLPRALHRVFHGSRVAGAVGEEHAVRLHGQDLAGGRRRGDDGDVEAEVDEAAEDVPLGAEVVGHALEAVPRPGALHLGERLVVGRGPLVGLGAGDHARQVPPVGGGGALGLGHEGRGVAVLGAQHESERALLADGLRELAGVHAVDGDDPVTVEPVLEGLGGAVVRRHRGELLHDEGLRPAPGGLHVLVGDAVVADERIGHHDPLARVGGVREDLLVAGHGRVEDEVTADLTARADGTALDDQSVLQREPGTRSVLFHTHDVLERPLWAACTI